MLYSCNQFLNYIQNSGQAPEGPVVLTVVVQKSIHSSWNTRLLALLDSCRTQEGYTLQGVVRVTRALFIPLNHGYILCRRCYIYQIWYPVARMLFCIMPLILICYLGHQWRKSGLAHGTIVITVGRVAREMSLLVQSSQPLLTVWPPELPWEWQCS